MQRSWKWISCATLTCTASNCKPYKHALTPRSLSESIDSKAENLGLELIVLRATDQALLAGLHIKEFRKGVLTELVYSAWKAVSFWQKMGQLGLRSGDPDPKLNSYAARYSAAPKNDKEKQLLEDGVKDMQGLRLWRLVSDVEEYGLLAWLEVPDDCRHMYKSLRP